VQRLNRTDAVVCIFVIGLLFIVSGAVTEHRAEIAKMVVCQAELHRMHGAVSMFAQDNEGYLWPDWWSFSFFSNDSFDVTYANMLWTYAIEDYLRNPRIFFCPSARKVASIDGNTPDPKSMFKEWGHTNWAWYLPWAPPMKLTGKPAMSSYGFNDWAAVPYRTNPIDQANADKLYWGSLNQEGADKIPLLFDSAWYAVTPSDQDGPPIDPNNKTHYQPGRSWAPVCIPRHNDGINMLFMDGSVRQVGIKELWTLKWNKTFDTQNKMTQREYKWPAWIEELSQPHHRVPRFNKCEDRYGNRTY
jgi:prepilin-type processing-associated H-X9-DG protein